MDQTSILTNAAFAILYQQLYRILFEFPMPLNLNTDKLLSALEIFAKKSVPYALANGVNRTAELGLANAKRSMSDRFILRRRNWNLRSLRVQKARPRDRVHISRFGTLQSYFRIQEEGASLNPGHIPTPYASNEKQTPRRRVPRARRIDRLTNLRRGGQRVGRQVFFLFEGSPKARKGVYARPFNRNGRKRRKAVRLVHDLSQNQVTIPQTQWFGAAYNETERRFPKIMQSAIQRELRRNRLL
ncbi:MAG: hypothetical protein KTR25_17855 [Myxococcales bacterium]|nr:hypothetical protein [Myxococcales bacterium]